MTTPPDPTPQRKTLTLLDWLRLHPDDHGAWKEFVDRYSPVIFHWAKARGLSAEDANDLTQTVFKRLVEGGLATFRRDHRPSAKPWLRTITHRAVSDWIEGKARKQQVEAEYAQMRLQDTCVELDRALDEEFDVEQLEGVLHTLRGSSHDLTWRCFERHWLDEQPIRAVADELGLSPAAARKNCYRMFVRVAKLLKGGETGPAA